MNCMGRTQNVKLSAPEGVTSWKAGNKRPFAIFHARCDLGEEDITMLKERESRRDVLERSLIRSVNNPVLRK
jgi:hypothetical protein